MGERRLKDIDEPERVYELVIEGVDQPAPADAASVSAEDGDFDERIAKLGERLSTDIKENVLRRLERALGPHEKPRQ